MKKKKIAKKAGKGMYMCSGCGCCTMKGGMHCGKMMKKK